MKKKLYALLILTVIAINFITAQTITFQNPSFEGIPAPHVLPPNWNPCQPGSTPDTQPGSWGITLLASNGSTYIGLVNQASANWQEGASQLLSIGLTVGTNYTFNIDLATTNSTLGGINPGCVELQVYGNMGGNSGCDMTALLWSSGDIYNIYHINQWVTHTVSFTPTQNWTNILFMSHNLGCTDIPYIMLDNISYGPNIVITNQNVSICNNPAIIAAGPGYDAYLWSNGDTTQATTVTSSGTYYVTASYNGVDTTDFINVTLTQPYMNLYLGNDTTLCGNNSIALDAGSGFNSYLWNTGTTNQSILAQQTGIYSVYTTDTANCSYYDTINVIINPAQSLDLGNDITLCSYAPTTLDAGIAFNTFLWSTGANTQTISVNTSGTYYVSATNIQCSVTAYDTINVNFNAVPIVNAGINDTICSGGSSTLSATGGNFYTWSPSGSLSCNNCVNPIASPTVTTVYTVTGTNGIGCTASDNVIINVVNATTSITNASCGHANGTATANSSGGSGSYSYAWSTTPAQNTQTAINLPPGSYSVSITDNILNCTIVRTASIINIPGPTIYPVSIVNANCYTNNGAITDSVSGGAYPYSFLWNSVPAQTSMNLVNVPPGNYCLTVTDNNGCTATNCSTVGTDAYPAPEICMVSVDTTTNYNIVIWEKPVTTGIDQYYIYRESNVLGIYNLIGTQNYSLYSTFIDNTSNALQQSYRYELAINDNCGFTSQNSAYHQTLHLTVNAGMGGTWNLIWNDYMGFPFYTYNIYRGTNPGNVSMINSVSSSVTSYTDLTPPPGILYYMIEVVRPTACSPTAKTVNGFSSTISNVAIAYGNSIDEFSKDGMVQIFPNPGAGLFTVNFTDPYFKSAGIDILNSLGQLLYQSMQTKPSESIDISDFAKGIYFIAIKVNQHTYYQKLVLQ